MDEGDLRPGRSHQRPFSALAQARKTLRQNRPKPERKGRRQALWWWGGPREAHQHPIGQPSPPSLRHQARRRPSCPRLPRDAPGFWQRGQTGPDSRLRRDLRTLARVTVPSRHCRHPQNAFFLSFFPDRLVGKLRAAARLSLSITVTFTPSV